VHHIIDPQNRLNIDQASSRADSAMRPQTSTIAGQAANQKQAPGDLLHGRFL